MWSLVNKKIIRDTWNFSQNKFEKHFTIIFERKNKKGQKRPHKAFFIKKNIYLVNEQIPLWLSILFWNLSLKNLQKSAKGKGKRKPQRANQRKNQNSKSSKTLFHKSSMGLKISRNTQKKLKSNQIDSQNLLYNSINLKLNQITINHGESKED